MVEESHTGRQLELGLQFGMGAGRNREKREEHSVSTAAMALGDV
jgi:hypothetical protein